MSITKTCRCGGLMDYYTGDGKFNWKCIKCGIVERGDPADVKIDVVVSNTGEFIDNTNVRKNIIYDMTNKFVISLCTTCKTFTHQAYVRSEKSMKSYYICKRCGKEHVNYVGMESTTTHTKESKTKTASDQ